MAVFWFCKSWKKKSISKMYLFINRISKISQFFQFFITGFLLWQKIIYFLPITSSRCHFSYKHKTNINKWVTDKWQWNMWPNKRTGLTFPVRTSKKRHWSLTTSLAKMVVIVTMMRKGMLILLPKISSLPLQLNKNHSWKLKHNLNLKWIKNFKLQHENFVNM